MSNYIFYGVTPVEFPHLGFKNPNRRGKLEYITMRRNRTLDKLFDNAESDKILWQKDKFKEHFSEYIFRKWIYINSSTTDVQIKSFFS